MKCPICETNNLALYNTLWPFNKILPRKFKCSACGWAKTKEEVLRAGGLEAFRSRRGTALNKNIHSHRKSGKRKNKGNVEAQKRRWNARRKRR